MGHYTTYRLRGSAVRQPQLVEVYAGPANGPFVAAFSSAVLGYASRFTSAYAARVTAVHLQMTSVAHTSTVFYAGIHLDSGGVPGALVGPEVGVSNNTLPLGTQVVTWTGLSSPVSSGQVLWVSLRIDSYPGTLPGKPTLATFDSELDQLSSGGTWSLYSETTSFAVQVYGLA